MTLEIVSHCWLYSRLLTYQLSSLVLHPPQKCEVVATVFWCAEDQRTRDVLDYFRAIDVPRVTWQFRELERTRLCRRAIGRNIACRETRADRLWLTDCDYLVGDGTLDAIALAEFGGPLAYPRRSHVTSQPRGDEYIEAVTAPGVYDVSAEDFERDTHGRAIGGIQIVPGDIARERGYLPDSRRFQSPSEVWVRTHCDRAFRVTLGTTGVPIDVPHVRRIRHSKRGRFDIGIQL